MATCGSQSALRYQYPWPKAEGPGGPVRFFLQHPADAKRGLTHFDGVSDTQTEPDQKAERRASIDDPWARAARISIAYKTVPGNTADFYALQVLGNVLGGGVSSRLNQKLVREKEMVTNANTFVQEMRGVGGFYIIATPRSNFKNDAVEAAIYDEVARLQKEPIADWELQKAKSGARRNFVNSLQSSLGRANAIGQAAVYYGDPNLINTRLDKVMAVTKEDVQRVANKYLVQTNRTVVITIPKAPMGRGMGIGMQQ